MVLHHIDRREGSSAGHHWSWLLRSTASFATKPCTWNFKWVVNIRLHAAKQPTLSVK